MNMVFLHKSKPINIWINYEMKQIVGDLCELFQFKYDMLISMKSLRFIHVFLLNVTLNFNVIQWIRADCVELHLYIWCHIFELCGPLNRLNVCIWLDSLARVTFVHSIRFQMCHHHDSEHPIQKKISTFINCTWIGNDCIESFAFHLLDALHAPQEFVLVRAGKVRELLNAKLYFQLHLLHLDQRRRLAAP